MKKIAMLILVALAVTACQYDQDDRLDLSVLEGTWHLTEVLFDPGDGSGEFRQIDSKRQMTLTPENTYTANYDVCQAIEEGENFTGSFDRIDAQEFLIPCAGSLLNSVQGRLEDGFLVLYYPCDEPCAYRFRKISDFKG